jgi:glycosyltransferase involved in cell wall biosynthesis
VTQETLHFVVPDGIDDPAQVSGGNVYDRRIAAGLEHRGRRVLRHPVSPDGEAPTTGRIPRDAVLLVDGLAAIRSPEEVERLADRATVVLLAHMVVAAMPSTLREQDAERRAFAAADRVIATSRWTAAELERRGLASGEDIVVATPGADPRPPSQGSRSGTRLLCVGAVAPHKGQDLLVDALSGLPREARWSCVVAGSTTVAPEFAAAVAGRARRLGERIRIAGVLTGRALDEAYRDADLLIAPSRAESYGMAIADALARGVPVVATDVGGIPTGPAGTSPAAMLVPAGDATALRGEIERWIGDPRRRRRMRSAALGSRADIPGWDTTVDVVASALEGAA